MTRTPGCCGHGAGRTPSAEVAAPPASASATRDAVALAAADLEEGEVVILAIRPHPLFILFASAGSLLSLAIALLLTAFVARKGWLPIDAGIVTTWGVILGFVRVFWQALVWFNEGYVLTNRRVVRSGGVFRRFRFECQLRRIQHLVMAKSIPERIFGLGTIGFATAGTGGIEAAWLAVGKADRVFETVREAVRHAGGGGV